MKFAWCYVLAIFAAFFVSAGLTKPPGDGDIFWQRWLGDIVLTTHHIPRALGTEAFAANGAPWVPQEWLFGVFAYLGRASSGSAIFHVAIACCAVSAIVLTVIRAMRRGATPAIAALVVTVTALALVEGFGIRAQVVAWPFFVALLLLLEVDGPAAWLAIPLTFVWANLHASVMLGLVLAAINALGHVLDERAWTPSVRRSVCIALGVSIAVCCNPFGFGLPHYALMLFGSPIRHFIDEWRMSDITDVSFLLAALPLLGATLVLGLGAPSRRWRDRLLFAATAYLLMTAMRNIAIFVLAAAPLVAESLARRFPAIDSPRVRRGGDVFFGAALALASLGIIFVLVHRMQEPSRLTGVSPVRAVLATERIAGRHNIFCASFEWCSLFLDHPNDRVFLDGRADPYPVAIWNDYDTLRTLAPGWQKLLSTGRIDTLLVERDSALGQAMALLPAWRSAYYDSRFRVYRRNQTTLEPRSRPVPGDGKLALISFAKTHGAR